MKELTGQIIVSSNEGAFAVGSGLLESAYEACLEYELKKQRLNVERQKLLPVVYDEVKLDCGYRIDLLVQNQVVLELKAVDQVAPIHEAQLLSYLKMSGCQVGLLINFNVLHLRDGIKRLCEPIYRISANSASSAVEEVEPPGTQRSAEGGLR